ncbi:uncharacterized protein LOC118816998 isoform X2 [Colossoma macropomum]|uniref:uncharacterized protein LOC118816998 isoform X2 n=1 Tax=Colossoma macropomum TaxID=42526 RepID=UPI00186411D3|nr:uncharacterized protein LOC118816998 isoform X2 [Colossoma macropomum]
MRQRLPLVTLSIILIGHVSCVFGVIFNHYTSYYEELCYDTCGLRGQSYYWCYTRQGWDYCSPRSDRDYKDRACQDDHPCGKYGKSYYWCYEQGMSDAWGYCGPVEPKTTLYISSTYQLVCNDDCPYDESHEYYWCHTDKGWDYCSPTPDVTYKNVPCRSDHFCGTHDYSYNWCWTTESEWDYCGVIKPGECTYYTTQRGIVSTFALKEIHSCTAVAYCTWTDKGNHVETTFYAEPDPTALADGSSWRNEITNLIARWDNGYLGNQPKSNLITSRNLRIDLQGMLHIDGQQYYNLQIQLNGQSTKVSQVLAPSDIPNSYVRFAFVESFLRRARVTVRVKKVIFYRQVMYSQCN